MIFRNLFSKKKPRAWWWKARPNFGDALAPLLLARFADLEGLEWTPLAEATIASVGSILELVPPSWTGHVLGSGKLRETYPLKFDPCKAKILAVRGPLSARGIPGEFALGDPGLLANELIDHQEKQWDIGILPHWLDDQLVPRFKKMIPARESVKIIRSSDDPLTVLKHLAACRKIVTSSLHGMIAADAFGIPRRFEYCKKMDREGGDFKFRDYSASIQCCFNPGKLMEPQRNRVEDRKSEIWEAYRELSMAYGKS
jgi:hypothetical protein